jgi:hypothetical protein
MMKRILAALALFSATPAFAQTPAQPLSAIVVSWDSNTGVANGTIPLLLPVFVGGGTIVSVAYFTGGTSTPSFTADLRIGSTDVTGCNALNVSSSTPATTACTGANTFVTGQVLSLVISAVSGVPFQAIVQVNFRSTLN